MTHDHSDLTDADPLKEELLTEIEAFQLRHRMSASRFGLLAVNDHKLIARIKTKSITTTTVARVRSFMTIFDSAAVFFNVGNLLNSERRITHD